MKYRKKPVLVDALQWTGANFVDMEQFLGSPRNGVFINHALYLPTGDGHTRVLAGSWVVCGPAGDYHPVRGDVFEQLYEPVDVMHHPV